MRKMGNTKVVNSLDLYHLKDYMVRRKYLDEVRSISNDLLCRPEEASRSEIAQGFLYMERMQVA